ncbi:MAG: hypothetical protein LBB45_08430 [Methanobrevibacter sp.]|jgi:hypothetical protein|nr:hypothetical protein [Candidatus Methanovirga basalitermitum]
MRAIELELSDDEVEYLNKFKNKGIKNAREINESKYDKQEAEIVALTLH